ncbi:MAG: nitrous oxide reductase family maturation protein NosD [Candidatus Thorarchaeota archaeon]
MNFKIKRAAIFLCLLASLNIINLAFQPTDLTSVLITSLNNPNGGNIPLEEDSKWYNWDAEDFQVLYAGKKGDNPILIEGDDDFVKQAKRFKWPGDGSEASPYIIENLIITVNARLHGKKPVPAAGIQINDTTLHFIIQHNLIDGVNGLPDGIALFNVIHGTIYDNTIVNCATGIFLYNSHDITITENYVFGFVSTSAATSVRLSVRTTALSSGSHAIWLDPSNHNTISNNHITGMSGSSIYLLSSSDNTVEGNEIDNDGGVGIFLEGSDDNIVDDNDIFEVDNPEFTEGIRSRVALSSGSHAIWLDPSSNNTVSNNNISDYTGYGIFLEASDDNDLTGNSIDNSDGDSGVFLANSSWNSITDNEVYSTSAGTTATGGGIRSRVALSSGSHAIWLDPSSNNTVGNNTLSGYTGYGIFLEGSDDNDLTGNSIDNSDGDSGVFLANSSWNSITDNEVYSTSAGTTATGDGIRSRVTLSSGSHAIWLDPSSNNTIANNTLSGYTGYGVFLEDSDDNDLTGNSIDNSDGDSGVFLANSSWNSITDNEVYSTSAGTTATGDGIRSRVALSSGSHAIWLDPSSNNTITNNTLSGFSGYGVFLEDSDGNDLTGNSIDNSDGDSGVFLANSSWNSITDNDIYGDYSEPTGSGMRIRSRVALSSGSHAIWLDPSHHNTISDNRIFSVSGNAVYLQLSNFNAISNNQISNSGANGIFLEGSSHTKVIGNVLYSQTAYAISLAFGSDQNSIETNDLVGNNIGGSSQASDWGLLNSFAFNYLVDNDNTDDNNDTLADQPYAIDGGNFDYTPNALPVQDLDNIDIQFADLDAVVVWESQTFNLQKEGNWVSAKIFLPEGYSASNVNGSTIRTDGNIYAEYVQLQHPDKIFVKFNRSEVAAYLETVVSSTPTVVKMNVTGYLKGDFLLFYGYDNITIINADQALAVVQPSQGDSSSSVIAQVMKHVLTPGIPAIFSLTLLTLLGTYIFRKKARKKTT